MGQLLIDNIVVFKGSQIMFNYFENRNNTASMVKEAQQ